MTATQPAPPTTTRSRPPGLPRSLEYPKVPVGSILRAAVRRWGDQDAFVQHDLPLTYTEPGTRAHAVAGRLADQGIGRGDVVALHIPNCRQYPSLYFGIMLSGATFSPTNPLLPMVRPALAASPVRP
jgi:long-chain acyl-CoA synthetase